MTVVGSMSASSRRAIVMLSLAAVCAASEARAQQAPAAGAAPPAQPAQPAQQAPPPDDFKFSSDAALVIWSIKPESVGDFEKVFGVMRSRMAASDNPEVKALGDSMKVFKPGAPPQPGQPITYFVYINPASKTATYNPTFVLFQAKKADGMTMLFERAEADELYKLLSGSIAGINALPLTAMP